MTDKLEDTSLRLKDEMDLYRKMMDKLRQNRLQFQKEKEEMQEVGGGGAIISRHARGQRRLFALRLALLPRRYSAVVFITPLLSLSRSLTLSLARSLSHCLCAADRGPPS